MISKWYTNIFFITNNQMLFRFLSESAYANADSQNVSAKVLLVR